MRETKHKLIISFALLNEDQVDSFAEKATIEIKKQYAIFDAKVLSKIEINPLSL